MAALEGHNVEYPRRFQVNSNPDRTNIARTGHFDPPHIVQWIADDILKRGIDGEYMPVAIDHEYRPAKSNRALRDRSQGRLKAAAQPI